MQSSPEETAERRGTSKGAGRKPLGILVRGVVFTTFLVLVGWVGTKVDWPAIGEQLANASIPYLLGMVATWVVALFIRPMKLWLLLSSAMPGIRPGYWPAFRADNIAMAVNSVVPARAGEVAMAFALRQSFGISTASSGSLVLIDRFLDFCTVVLFFVVSFIVYREGSSWVREATIWVAAVVAIFISGLFLTVRLRRVWISLLGRMFSRLGSVRAKKWEERVRDLFSILVVIDDVRRMIALMLLSGATWAMISLSYWFGIHSVWPDISFTAAAFTASAVALSFLMPIAPAGIGLFQGAAILSLQLFGVSTSAGLAFGILAHALQVGAILALAAISMAWQGISLRTLATMRATERRHQAE